MSLLPASIKKDRFPHYKSMGAFCCHGNQSFDPICPKTLCSFSPTPDPVMLHIKIWSSLANWLQRYSSLKMWTTTDDDDGQRRRTDDGPLVYYKLTLWAFGLGELKMACAPSEDSNQPGHLPNLIRVFTLHMTLIGLGGCPSWSESLLSAQVILLVLSCCSSNRTGFSLCSPVESQLEKTSTYLF